MVPVSWLLVSETKVVFVDGEPKKEDVGREAAPPGVAYEARRSVAEYGRQVWELLRGRAMLCVVRVRRFQASRRKYAANQENTIHPSTPAEEAHTAYCAARRPPRTPHTRAQRRCSSSS